MCTVTFIPKKEGFILTSSRDEMVYRPTLPPHLYEHQGQKIVYPKDEVAGGTWVAAGLKNQFACLLNGAFGVHQKQPHHTRSRGQVLLENFAFDQVMDFVEQTELHNVEPFTLLLIRKGLFIELRWDGKNKYIKEITPNCPMIWSSPTLYDKDVRVMREKWFHNWINANQSTPDYNISGFHSSTHSNNGHDDIVMKRENGVQTLSITQIDYQNNRFKLWYNDLHQEVSSSMIFDSEEHSV